MAHEMNTLADQEARSEASTATWRDRVRATTGIDPGGRAVLIALAAIAVTGGLALNWGWLVAIGIGPVLVAALPCVAMCALGLCMQHRTQRADASDDGKNFLRGKSCSSCDEGTSERPASISPGSRRPS